MVGAAVAEGDVLSHAERAVTPVEEHVLDRAAVIEVVLDAIVPAVLHVDAADRPIWTAAVVADAIPIIEDPQVLDMRAARVGLGDLPVLVVHRVPGRGRGELAEHLPAGPTEVQAAAEVRRLILRLRRKPLGGGGIDSRVVGETHIPVLSRLSSSECDDWPGLGQARDGGRTGRPECGTLRNARTNGELACAGEPEH